MKTTHYVISANKLNGDNEVFFYHTSSEAESKFEQLKHDESRFVKIGSINLSGKKDYYFANVFLVDSHLRESEVLVNTENIITKRFDSYEEDYAEFRKEDCSSQQVRYHLDFMNAIDVIRWGKIEYQTKG